MSMANNISNNISIKIKTNSIFLILWMLSHFKGRIIIQVSWKERWKCNFPLCRSLWHRPINLESMCEHRTMRGSLKILYHTLCKGSCMAKVSGKEWGLMVKLFISAWACFCADCRDSSIILHLHLLPPILHLHLLPPILHLHLHPLPPQTVQTLWAWILVIQSPFECYPLYKHCSRLTFLVFTCKYVASLILLWLEIYSSWLLLFLLFQDSF